MEKPGQQQSYVSMRTYADGTVQVQISGQNGQSLTLVADVTGPEPFAEVPKSSVGKGLYRAVVGVQANVHLKGWLVDQQND